MNDSNNTIIKFSSIICLLISIGMLIYGLNLNEMIKKSASWPKVKGHIISSKMKTKELLSERQGSTRRKTVYKADINYSYIMDGEKRTSDRVTISRLDYTEKSYIYQYEQMLKKFKPGVEVDVYYNPDDKNVTVLIVNDTESAFGTFAGSVMFFIFSIISYLLYRYKN